MSLSGRDLSGIEILFDDKNVAKKLAEALRPSRYRQ